MVVFDLRFEIGQRSLLLTVSVREGACDGMGGAIGPQRDLVAQRVGRRIMRLTAKNADGDCSSLSEVGGVVVASCMSRSSL